MSSTTTLRCDTARTGTDPNFVNNNPWRKYVSVDLGTTTIGGNSFDRLVRAGVLVVENWLFNTGPLTGQTHTLVLIATTTNEIFCYSEETLLAEGAAATPLWQTPLGVVPIISVGSNIAPLVGICGTPVVDTAKRSMFVVAMGDDGSGTYTSGKYFIFNVALDTGSTTAREQLVDPGAPGRATFNDNSTNQKYPNANDQRTAINLVDDWLWIGFADFQGDDFGRYYGWIVAINANDLTQQLYQPMISLSSSNTWGIHGGGVWGLGGIAAATDNTVFVLTGNATQLDDTPGDQRMFWSSSFDGKNWAPQQPGIGGGTSAGPSLAVFQNQLYAAWKGVSGDERMFWSSSFDGKNWAPQQPGVGGGTSAGPSLAVFQNQLYAAWKGVSGDERMFWSSFDGKNWAPQQVGIGGGKTTVGPSLAVFQNQLYAAWRGPVDDDGMFWSSSFDGKNWATQKPGIGGGKTTVGPSLAVFQNQLYAAWRGASGDEKMYWSSFDGKNWATQQPGIGGGTSAGPSLAVFQNQLYAAWKGVSGDERMFWSSFDGKNWAPPQLGIGGGTSARPSLAVFQNQLYAAWKGVGGDPDGINPRDDLQSFGKDYWHDLSSARGPGTRGDYFNALVRLGITVSGTTPQITVFDWFQSSSLTQNENANDYDFGGSSPVVLPPIDGRQLVAFVPKDGNIFVLDSQNLGKYSEPLTLVTFADALHHENNDTKVAISFLQTPDARNILIVGADSNGGTFGGLAAFEINATATLPTLTKLWQAPFQLRDSFGSPLVIANYGLNPANRIGLAWVVDGDPGNTLVNCAVRVCDVLTGKLIYDSTTHNDVTEEIPHFAPITSGGHSVFCATANGFMGFTQFV